MGLKKLGFKNCGFQRIFGRQKFLGPKTFQVPKIFKSGNILGPKKCLVTRNVGSQNILIGSVKSGSFEFGWVPKNFDSTNIWVTKI